MELPTLLICYSSSSRLRLANGGGQDPNDDGSPTLADIQPLPRANGGAPQVAKSRSGQSSISANRSVNFPIEGSEVPLAKLLENPPRPYILTAEIHIIVPCFVHDVHSLYFEPHSNTYVCYANGIWPFRLVTSERLKICINGHRSPSGYLLARTWDPRLSHTSSNTSHGRMSLLRQRLVNHFFAILLEPSPHDRFRRISTEGRIVAQLEQPPSQTYGVRFLHLQ
jgi:hypothetical protein